MEKYYAIKSSLAEAAPGILDSSFDILIPEGKSISYKETINDIPNKKTTIKYDRFDDESSVSIEGGSHLVNWDGSGHTVIIEIRDMGDGSLVSRKTDIAD